MNVIWYSNVIHSQEMDTVMFISLLPLKYLPSDAQTHRQSDNDKYDGIED